MGLPVSVNASGPGGPAQLLPDDPSRSGGQLSTRQQQLAGNELAVAEWGLVARGGGGATSERTRNGRLKAKVS
jgi:hypothetical protein